MFQISIWKFYYDLCDNSDIVFLQETLLFPHELSVLFTAHPEFEGMGVSAIDMTERMIVGRPYGGVAILIRKKLREYCNFLCYDDPRIMGIEFKSITDCIYFMNVYMPYQCTDNYDCYVVYLEKSSAILEECTTTKITIVGDFNAAVSTSVETELLALCESQNLVISDYQLLGRLSEKFTFVSDAHSTTSWLDHFICSHDLHQRITTLHILDKTPCSDHMPIMLYLILMF